MADIQKIHTSLPIKAGTVVMNVQPTGIGVKNSDNVKYDKPPISEIENKYQERFDDY